MKEKKKPFQNQESWEEEKAGKFLKVKEAKRSRKELQRMHLEHIGADLEDAWN